MTDTPRPTDPSDPAPRPRDDRDLDIVVFGATGFVGRLVAAQLADVAPDGVRIGLAGRSLERVDAVKSGLGARAAAWKVLHADSADPESLRAMARRAQVVATTVGPYAAHGLPLVAACADEGTDYVDLTGESLFVRESIDGYDARAKETGARIVHACGFDSIPSDLGVFVTWRQAVADDAGDLLDTTLYVTSLKGGMSGGTIASIIGQVDAIKERPELRRLLSDPYALSPDRAAEPSRGRPDRAQAGGLASAAAGVAGGLLRGVLAPFTPDPDIGGHTAPFLMGPFNAQVVRRSNALLSWSYGRGFRYRELVSTGKAGNVAASLRAAAMTLAVPAGLAGLAFGPTRALLDRVVTKPGDGPSPAARQQGRFTMKIHAATTSGARYVTTVSAQADPGYDGTAVMIAAAALALVADADALPDRHGVLTPATGIGEPLITRLRHHGFTIAAERVAG